MEYIKKKEEYFVRIRVKSYVYKYLIENFSVKSYGVANAVSFRNCTELNSYVTRILDKNSNTYDAEYMGRKGDLYNKEVYLLISERIFVREGFNLSETAEHIIARHLESIVKSDFLMYATHMYMMIDNLVEIVERYKRLNGYSEDDWSQESMIKILRRKFITDYRKKQRELFLQNAENIFVTCLSLKKYVKRVDTNLIKV